MDVAVCSQCIYICRLAVRAEPCCLIWMLFSVGYSNSGHRSSWGKALVQCGVAGMVVLYSTWACCGWCCMRALAGGGALFVVVALHDMQYMAWACMCVAHTQSVAGV